MTGYYFQSKIAITSVTCRNTLTKYFYTPDMISSRISTDLSDEVIAFISQRFICSPENSYLYRIGKIQLIYFLRWHQSKVQWFLPWRTVPCYTLSLLIMMSFSTSHVHIYIFMYVSTYFQIFNFWNFRLHCLLITDEKIFENYYLPQ